PSAGCGRRKRPGEGLVFPRRLAIHRFRRALPDAARDRYAAANMSRDYVLVTGGSGIIGSHLTERLLAEGRRGVVLDDGSTGALENLAAVEKDPRLEVICARVSQWPGLETLTREAAFVFHLAAAVGVDLVVRSPVETIHNNLAETEAVLRAAAAARVPFLF